MQLNQNIYESIVDIADKINSNNNYKDQLLKFYQKNKWGYPKYKQTHCETNKIDSHNYNTVFTSCVYNNLTDEVVGLGRGKSKKTAEQNASKNALIYFNEIID